MHRRLAAMAASVLLLNLNVIGVDRACGPSHDVEQDAAQEHAGHAGHTVAPLSAGGPEHTPPPQHGAPSKCCDAISSCGMTLSLGHEVHQASAAGTNVAAPMSARDAHSSAPRAPEPPPPRA